VRERFGVFPNFFRPSVERLYYYTESLAFAQFAYPGLISTLFAGSGSGEQRRRYKRPSFCWVLHAVGRRVTSEPHLGQCRERFDVCRQAHLPPLCGLSFPRLLGFAGEANRVAADHARRESAVHHQQTSRARETCYRVSTRVPTSEARLIDHGRHDNGLRESPACRFEHPSHAHAARYETQDGRLVHSL
jgi:hypothetical protein